MNDLDYFLNINDIGIDVLLEALHLDIRETILKTVCEALKKDSSYYMQAKKIFFSTNNDLDATKKIVSKVCDCKLSENDYAWLATCLKAFFKKSEHRQNISAEAKKELLIKQDYRCTICGEKIDLHSMHADHIIPWDYVGDILIENMQALCSDCNLSKSNHVARTVTNIILHNWRH